MWKWKKNSTSSDSKSQNSSEINLQHGIRLRIDDSSLNDDVSEVSHFVVKFDVTTAEAEVEMFPCANLTQAEDTFRRVERKQAEKAVEGHDVRVLLFSAESEQVLRSTHPHYFAEAARELEEFGSPERFSDEVMHYIPFSELLEEDPRAAR